MVLNDDTLEPQTIVFHDPTGSSRKPKTTATLSLLSLKKRECFKGCYFVIFVAPPVSGLEALDSVVSGVVDAWSDDHVRLLARGN